MATTDDVLEEEFEAEGGSAADEAFDRVFGRPSDGVSTGGPVEGSDRGYFESYADPGVHRLMIADRTRTDAYRRAIEALVRPGRTTVLDVGTGTGILALFAARAGARRVWGVDESSILDVAHTLARANALDRKVTFLRGRAEQVRLPQRVDLLVSEWMGFFALAECMFASVVMARDRHLAPDGVIVPSALRLYFAPVEDESLHADLGVGLWEKPVYGFDFTHLVDHELECPITSSVDLNPDAMIGEAVQLIEIDCRSAAVEDFFFDTRVTLEVVCDATLHGFAGWFDVDLGAGVTLSTAPSAPATHWRQSFFPVRPFPVRVGDRIDLKVRARPKEYGDRRLPLYFMEAVLVRAGVEVHRCFYRHEASFE